MKLEFNPNQNNIQGEHMKKSHIETMAALTDIGNNVKELLAQQRKLWEVQSALITLSKAPQNFNAEGYRFNSVFVDDAQVADTLKLIINVQGQTFTKTLAAGENIVNIPDGAQITVSNTSGNAAPLVLYRFNYLRQ